MGLIVVKLGGALAKRSARKSGADTPFDVDAVDDLPGGHLVYDSTRARTELGVTYRPAREVLADALRWLVHVGALPERAASKARAALGERARPDADWS